jgi:alpha-amylase
MKFLLASCLLFLGIFPVQESLANVSAKRTVMLQLFHWNWNSIAEECEKEIGPAGYSAVQIPPPQEHIVMPDAPWWERYQPISYKLHSRSGTESQFRAMVARCKQAGVDIYADVVLNHMSALSSGQGFAGTSFRHYEYAGLWNVNHFHRCGKNGNNGLVDFTNLYELQNCDLLGMADLDTGAEAVQKRLAEYLNHLLDLGVAGFRIDAAKHVSAQDLKEIFQRINRKHYRVLELIVSPGEPVTADEYLPVGDLNNFSYAYAVGEAFFSKNLDRLPNLAKESGIPTDSAVVFLENHDLERRPDSEPLLTYRKNPRLFQLGMVFLLTWPYGYPQVYSGFSFSNYDLGPPLDEAGMIRDSLRGAACSESFTCVHRFSWMKALVKFRNFTDSQFLVSDFHKEENLISYGRGALGHVVISLSEKHRDIRVKTKLSVGKYCNLIEIPQKQINCGFVDKSGFLHLTIPPLSAFVSLGEGNGF